VPSNLAPPLLWGFTESEWANTFRWLLYLFSVLLTSVPFVSGWEKGLRTLCLGRVRSKKKGWSWTSFCCTCTRSCAACCRWHCFGKGAGLDDPQRSLPTPTILWFCECFGHRVAVRCPSPPFYFSLSFFGSSIASLFL